MKKVAGGMTWRNIPAVGKKDNFVVPNKKARRGKAGSSGSPWLIHSKTVGTYSSPSRTEAVELPSVAWVSRWILDTVNANGGGRLVWATTEQARGKR